MEMNQNQLENLVKLEELMHNKYLNPQLLHQLIALYTRAIEHLDNIKSNLKEYFLEKIRFILSREEIKEMLQLSSKSVEPQKKSMMQTLRQTIRLSGVDEVSNSFNEINFRKKKEPRVRLNYDDQKTKEKVDMQMEVMKEVEKNMKDLKEEADKIDEKSKQNKKVVDSIAKRQDEKLKERLERRKKKIKRKNSLDMQDVVEEPQKVKKQELIKAQVQLDEAVTRFTMRLTQKLMLGGLKKEQSKGQEKGRIKTIRKQEQDDQW